MNWQSSSKVPTKIDRASILSMSLAILLMQAGERCAVMGETNMPRTGRIGLERIALRLAGSTGETSNLSADIPAHARLVISSDFLEGEAVWQERLARLSARPAKGILIHIIDPAERDFPFKGRVKLRFPGLSKLEPLLVGRAEQARENYREKFDAHCASIAQPLWLLLFRLCLAALIAIALAAPIMGNKTSETSRPLTLVIDTGWDAAPSFTAIIRDAEARLTKARRDNLDVLLLTTTENPQAVFTPAAEAMNRLKTLTVSPLPSNRAAAAQALKDVDISGSEAVWLSSDLDFGAAELLGKTLTRERYCAQHSAVYARGKNG